LVDGRHETLSGTGNGPVAALIDGLRRALDLDLVVRDYSQHAMTPGTEASAAAYIEVVDPRGGTTWGVGMDSSTLDASLGAVISAANRLRGRAVEA
jgi:2-isopropylmalate synthase